MHGLFYRPTYTIALCNVHRRESRWWSALATPPRRSFDAFYRTYLRDVLHPPPPPLQTLQYWSSAAVARLRNRDYRDISRKWKICSPQKRERNAVLSPVPCTSPSFLNSLPSSSFSSVLVIDLSFPRSFLERFENKKHILSEAKRKIKGGWWPLLLQRLTTPASSSSRVHFFLCFYHDSLLLSVSLPVSLCSFLVRS